MMYTYVHKIRSNKFLFSLSIFLLICLFAFSACGTNTTTGSPSGSGTAPSGTNTAPGSPSVHATPTSTSTTGVTASTNGCPDHSVVTPASTAASVILTMKESNRTVTVSKGALVEIDLPFGQSWTGPVSLPQNFLLMQQPAGYAVPAIRSCVWRFTAKQAGTAQLSFIGRPLCKKGQFCPMYVMAVPFTIEIK